MFFLPLSCVNIEQSDNPQTKTKSDQETDTNKSANGLWENRLAYNINDNRQWARVESKICFSVWFDGDFLLIGRNCDFAIYVTCLLNTESIDAVWHNSNNNNKRNRVEFCNYVWTSTFVPSFICNVLANWCLFPYGRISVLQTIENRTNYSHFANWKMCYNSSTVIFFLLLRGQLLYKRFDVNRSINMTVENWLKWVTGQPWKWRQAIWARGNIANYVTEYFIEWRQWRSRKLRQLNSIGDDNDTCYPIN